MARATGQRPAVRFTVVLFKCLSQLRAVHQIGQPSVNLFVQMISRCRRAKYMTGRAAHEGKIWRVMRLRARRQK
jgi:hypothetical protein